MIWGGMSLLAYLICHCNPKSKCPKPRLASVLLELRVACEHLPRGCRIWDVSHDCQWDCAAFRGCWIIRIPHFGSKLANNVGVASNGHVFGSR